VILRSSFVRLLDDMFEDRGQETDKQGSVHLCKSAVNGETLSISWHIQRRKLSRSEDSRGFTTQMQPWTC